MAVAEVRIVLVGKGVDHATRLRIVQRGDEAALLGERQITVIASASHG
jgi:hypothetical protein